MKELIEKRKNFSKGEQSNDSLIISYLKKPCLDTVEIFYDENIQFQVNGMNPENVHKHVQKLISKFNYNGITKDDENIIDLKEVKNALNCLVENCELRKNELGDYSPFEEKTSYEAMNELNKLRA